MDVRSSERTKREVKIKRHVKHQIYLHYIQEIFAGEEEMNRLEKIGEYLDEVDEEDDDYVSFCKQFPYAVFWEYTVTRPTPQLATEALYCFGKTTFSTVFDAASFVSPEVFAFLTDAMQVSKKSCKAVLEILLSVASASADLCRLVYENFVGCLMALPVSAQLASLVDTLFSVRQVMVPDVVPLILKLLATEHDVHIWTSALSAMYFALEWELDEEQVQMLWSTIQNNLVVYFQGTDPEFVQQFFKTLAMFSPLSTEIGAAVLEKIQFFLSNDQNMSEKRAVLIQCAKLVTRNAKEWSEILAVPWADMTFTVLDVVPYNLQRALVRNLNLLWDFSSITENAELFAAANFRFISDENIGVMCMHNLSVLIEGNTENIAIVQMLVENQDELEHLSETVDDEIAEAANAILGQI